MCIKLLLYAVKTGHLSTDILTFYFVCND